MKSHPHKCVCLRLNPAPCRTLRRSFIAASLPLIGAAFSACDRRSTNSDAANRATPVLLFTGTGTSVNDVAAIESILERNHLNYSTASSPQLNAMTESQISQFRLVIVPGGNFIDMGNSLTASTTANVRNAVRAGVNYLGICAGGFLAGKFPSPYKSFDLTSGVKFGFYSGEKHGTRKAALRIAMAEGLALDEYWEDGPEFTGWGEVIGKYPDGTPAIVEGSAGQGRLILSGVHPEAPASWRDGMPFSTPVSVNTAYAAKLIFAALNRVELPHY